MRTKLQITQKKNCIKEYSLKEITEVSGVYIPLQNSSWRFINTKTSNVFCRNYDKLSLDGWSGYKFIQSNEEIHFKFSN